MTTCSNQTCNVGNACFRWFAAEGRFHRFVCKVGKRLMTICNAKSIYQQGTSVEYEPAKPAMPAHSTANMPNRLGGGRAKYRMNV